MSTRPNYVTGTEAVAGWRDGVLSGAAPVLYDVGGPSWSPIEIGPGLITLLGGAPGAGKTALAMQWLFEALDRTKDLRAVIANVEMSPAVLMDRQLARMAGLSATDIRFRRFDREATAVKRGVDKIGLIAERMAFLKPPFSLENVAAVADDCDATVIILDYIQRFTAPGEYGSPRESMTAIMAHLRQFADADRAILVLSAVTRGRSEKGSTYDRDSLSLASFRESSEIEYSADAAWLISDNDKKLHLDCLKNRHGETPSLVLNFDKSRQTFTLASEFSGRIVEQPQFAKPKRLTRKELHQRTVKTDAARTETSYDDIQEF